MHELRYGQPSASSSSSSSSSSTRPDVVSWINNDDDDHHDDDVVSWIDASRSSRYAPTRNMRGPIVAPRGGAYDGLLPPTEREGDEFDDDFSSSATGGRSHRRRYRSRWRYASLACAIVAMIVAGMAMAAAYRDRPSPAGAAGVGGDDGDDVRGDPPIGGDGIDGTGSAATEDFDRDDGNDMATHRPLDEVRFDHIRYALIDRGASRYEAFLDENSAQRAALVWLTRDDPRQLDPESAYLEQRYGLAVLWFCTTGNGLHEWRAPEIVVDARGEGGGGDDVGPRGDDELGDVKYVADDDGDIDRKEDDNDVEGGRRDLATRSVQTVQDRNGWFRHENWLSSSGVCGWEGIACAQREEGGDGGASHDDARDDGYVTRVELRRNNVRGPIPDELYRTLPYLEVLDLSDNGLVGALGPEVAGMHQLQSLNLTSNDIAGSIVAEIGDMTTLEELLLADNQLEYLIPNSIGNMTSLRRLDLSGNSIQGTIPRAVGQLRELTTLDLSWNLLFGPIPHELSELQALVSLDVGHNNLGGPLVSDLSGMTHLAILRLNDNHFSGEVPAEIGSLTHLEELRLNNNNFRGTLPGSISKLEGLDSLSVANNHFGGTFPVEWTSMAGLQHLDVSANELMGEIPISIDAMKNLRSLNMAHNAFSSTIPSELGSLYKLEYLYLDDNEFDSSVPKELGGLTNLKKMSLHSNYLVGNIDDHVCKLADDLFLTQLSADCGGETPELSCDCCICHDRDPNVHLNAEP